MSKIASDTPVAVEQGTLTQAFTLDQLRPNPDNPRTMRNPCFNYIKASIRARGLASVPVVTRDPRLPEGIWTFSDGGNTRYAILKELWEETGESRFYEITCAVKPWPGRLNCLVGHLAENEGRGSLSFIEKALGVQQARKIHEAESGKKVSLRELSAILAKQGLPVHYSSISRMEDTLEHLYPWMPTLLMSGFKRESISQLLSLRHSAEKVWDSCRLNKGIETVKTFAEVFGCCCQKFDDPESWSQDMFIDEFIGDLTEALPDDNMDYDRWLLELRDARKPRLQREDLEQSIPACPAGFDIPQVEVTAGDVETDIDFSVADAGKGDKPQIVAEKTPPEVCGPADDFTDEPSSDLNAEPTGSKSRTKPAAAESRPPALPGEMNESEASLWQINALQDDIEHLQSMAYRLCWEISEALDCAEYFEPACEDETAPGYRLVSAEGSHPVALLLSALAGSDVDTLDMGRTVNLLIGSSQSHTPLLNDDMTLTLFRLVRVLRRLRELQRQAAAPSSALPTEELNNEH